MLIECSSNMFHVDQPDTYWHDYSYLEENENDWHQSQLEERVVLNKDQKYMDLGKNIRVEKGVKRRNLPDDHPDYMRDGTFELCGEALLEKVLAPAWIESFDQRVQNEAKKLGIRVKIKQTGVNRPKYYNFETDAVLFAIHTSKKNLQILYKHVMSKEKQFEDYLYKYQSSYDGFWSFMPNTLAAFEECWKCSPGSVDFERAIACLFEFWIFYEEYQEDTDYPDWYEDPSFRPSYHKEVEERLCNICSSELMEFVPAQTPKEWTCEYPELA